MSQSASAGEVIAKPSSKIVHFGSAKTHVKHVSKRLNAFINFS